MLPVVLVVRSIVWLRSLWGSATSLSSIKAVSFADRKGCAASSVQEAQRCDQCELTSSCLFTPSHIMNACGIRKLRSWVRPCRPSHPHAECFCT